MDTVALYESLFFHDLNEPVGKPFGFTIRRQIIPDRMRPGAEFARVVPERIGRWQWVPANSSMYQFVQVDLRWLFWSRSWFRLWFRKWLWIGWIGFRFSSSCIALSHHVAKSLFSDFASNGRLDACFPKCKSSSDLEIIRTTDAH